MHNQDLRIATEAWERGAGLIIVVNKWDLVEEKDANTARRGQEELIAKAPFLRYVPFVYVSALTGQRARKVLDLILEVADAREQRIPTAEVNRVLTSLLERNAPPQKPGEEVKLLYASQIAHRASHVRDREQPARGRSRLLSAIPRARLPLRVAVHRLAAPAQVHRAAARVGHERRAALAARVLPGRGDSDELSRGSVHSGHRPPGAWQQEPRRDQPLPDAGLALCRAGRAVRYRQGRDPGARLCAKGVGLSAVRPRVAASPLSSGTCSACSSGSREGRASPPRRV